MTPTTPLDVLSLDETKLFLKVDFTDDDALITSLISAAVSLVEQTTSHRLYQRSEFIQTSKFEYEAFQYPLNSASVVAQDSANTNTYTAVIWPQTLRTKIFWGQGFFYQDYNYAFFTNYYYQISAIPQIFNLTLGVGYSDTALIPLDLITAIKQIITFTYENRDLTKLSLPDNVMMLLQPYIRFSNLL